MSTFTAIFPTRPLDEPHMQLVRTTLYYELLRRNWLSLSRQSEPQFEELFDEWTREAWTGEEAPDGFGRRVLLALLLWNVKLGGGDQSALDAVLSRVSSMIKNTVGFRQHLKTSVLAEGQAGGSTPRSQRTQPQQTPRPHHHRHSAPPPPPLWPRL